MTRYAKAIGAFLTSTLAWGVAVVDSVSAPVTAHEWIALAGVGVTTITVYLLTNAPATDPPRA